MGHTLINRKRWNKGKIVGQKAPLKLKDIWALRVRLQIARPTQTWLKGAARVSKGLEIALS